MSGAGPVYLQELQASMSLRLVPSAPSSASCCWACGKHCMEASTVKKAAAVSCSYMRKGGFEPSVV